MNRQKQRTLSIVLPAMILVLLAVACTSVTRSITSQSNVTATPSTASHPETPVSTANATATSLPITRTWETGPVLLDFGPASGGPAPYGTSTTPRLILYSDGRLIINDENGLNESHLTRREMCALLNTIDQTGFFDFDVTIYESALEHIPRGEVDFTLIKVNAWKSRFEVVEDTGLIMDNLQVNVPYPLRAVYQLLSKYRPEGVQPYRSDQIAFTIYKYPTNSAYKAENAWPLKSPSLNELLGQAKVRNRFKGLGLLLEGSTATRVYDELNGKEGMFSENNETYFVDARPLLPYESLESAVDSRTLIPSPGVPITSTLMSCHPSDGSLKLP